MRSRCSTRSGQRLATRAFPTTASGYRRLLDWAATHGTLDTVAIEGANTYGAGLTRAARARGLEVVEVTRPERKVRDGRGKSDPIDAEAAARAALAGTATVISKTPGRPGGDASRAAGLSRLGHQGSHPGRQPAARADHHRPG
jgi:transposase